MTWIKAVLMTIASTLALVAVPSPSQLFEVRDFGRNPGNLRMHLYVPASVRPAPAVVVAMHGCTGSGPGFYESSEFATLADQHGFIVIYPSASKRGNCFDVWSAASQRRNGSDPASIVSMVNYVKKHHDANPRRIFATGGSSGAMATGALLILYPEIFTAGAAFMGIPFTCFSSEADFGPNTPCFTGTTNKTPREWGAQARRTNPDHPGPWPRIQLWHGTNDTLITYPVHQEQVDQWTNLHGLTTPTTTDTPQPGWTRHRYGPRTGPAKVEAITVTAGEHNLPTTGMARHAIEFFGLTG
jgi:poly(hydroxyalkanoate) depolymerase family esterase